MTWKLYEGDCLKVIPTFQNNSFDLIILDPPYNINKDEWDKIGTHDEYLKFIEDVLVECQRVLKDNGSLYLWHNHFPVLGDFQWLIKEKTDLVFKQMLTWEKFQTNKQYFGRNFLMGFNNENKRNYHLMAEYCLFYTFKDETGLTTIMDNHIKPLHPFAKYLREEFEKAGVTRKEIAQLFPSKTGGLTGCVSNWLNGDNVITKEQYHIIKDYLNGEYLCREYEDLRREYEDLRYTFNMEKDTSTVFLYPPEKKNGHLTPKSISLTTKLIRHSSNLDDNILIPFAGSGNEMIASINLNRNVTGIEQNSQYCQLIRERLNEHTTQSRLTLPAK